MNITESLQSTPTDTIIYGGAFNPPTRAHEAILQACIDTAAERNGDVWVVPSGNRRDKQIDVNRQQRLTLIDAMIADVALRNVNVTVSARELDRTQVTETFDTVQELNNEYPDRRFIWVFGSDSVATMPDWHEGEWLVDNLPMLVVERPGSPIQQLGRNAERLAVISSDISSTLIRNRIERNEPIDDLVTPTVLQQLVSQ